MLPLSTPIKRLPNARMLGTKSFKLTKCEDTKITIDQFSNVACATQLTDTYKSVVLEKDKCVAVSATKWVKTSAITAPKSASYAKAGLATPALTVYSYMS